MAFLDLDSSHTWWLTADEHPPCGELETPLKPGVGHRGVPAVFAGRAKPSVSTHAHIFSQLPVRIALLSL